MSPAVDRLSHEIRQAELGVQPLSGVAQVLGDECDQSQVLIQLVPPKQSGSQSKTRDPWNATFKKPLNVN